MAKFIENLKIFNQSNFARLTSRSFSSVPFMNYHMEIAGGDFGYDNGKIRCKVLLMKVNRKKSAPFSVFYLH